MCGISQSLHSGIFSSFFPYVLFLLINCNLKFTNFLSFLFCNSTRPVIFFTSNILFLILEFSIFLSFQFPSEVFYFSYLLQDCSLFPNKDDYSSCFNT